MIMNIEVFISEIYENAKRKNLYSDVKNNKKSFSELCTHLHSEVSELHEEYILGKDMCEIYYEGDKPRGIPIELADIILLVLSIAKHFTIPIVKALFLKHKYNKIRPIQHGKKRW